VVRKPTSKESKRKGKDSDKVSARKVPVPGAPEKNKTPGNKSEVENASEKKEEQTSLFHF